MIMIIIKVKGKSKNTGEYLRMCFDYILFLVFIGKKCKRFN